jgi:hypothetical protein
MTLAKPLAALLMALILKGDDVSLRVVKAAVPPVHPALTISAGLAVVEVEVNEDSAIVLTRILHGETPFINAALTSLAHWRFAAPGSSGRAQTSVTFLFRPPMIHAIKPLTEPVKPWNPLADAPALPKEVVDPGYPVNSLAQGAVILAAHVDTEGNVNSIDTITGVGSFTEPAIQAVQRWKFTPSRIAGRPAPAKAYVVISFVRPT